MFTLFFAALIISASALGPLPLTKQQHMDVLAELHNHPLGEAIFSQISLHMSAQGYLGDVVEMVEGILAELAEVQGLKDEIHAQARATCDRLLPEYAANIAANQQAAETCDQTVADTQGLLADAEDQLAATIAELDSVNARMVAGQEQRDREHAAWTALDQEHTDGVNACQDAVNLVASLSRGSLFIQLQGRIKSVSTRLEKMTQLNDKFTAYAPLISSFAQIASSSKNPQLLSQITSLLNTLRDQIAATQQADAGWEARKAAAWEQELSDLTAQREALTNRRSNLESNIANYHTIIEQQTEAGIFHREEVAKYTFLLNQQQSWCDAEQVAYDAETARRDGERDVLGQLRDYIAGRMDAVEEFIMLKQTTY